MIDDIIRAVNARAMSRGEHLFPYQEVGARRLSEETTAFLGDAMGLGKTWQLVTATPPTQALVVCPSAVLWPWAKTFRFLRTEFKVRIIERRADWRMPKPGEVVVSGFGILPPGLHEIDRELREIADRVSVVLPPLIDPATGEAVPWTPTHREKMVRLLMDAGAAREAPGEWAKMNRLIHGRRRLTVPHRGTLLIVDEAHRAKDPAALVTGRLRQLSRITLQHGGRVWLASGTPMKNRLDELWTVLQAANLGVRIFGDGSGSARQARGQFDIDALFPDRIATKLRNSSAFLRREREDVLPDLPAKTIETVEVPLDKDTTKLADEIVLGLKAAGVDIHTATLDALNTAAMKSIPREMMSALRAKLAAAKVPVMLDLVADLEESEVPVVVFCDHVAALEQLNRRERWAKITGSESSDEKEKAIESFQAGKLAGVAVSIRAGGVGITLTRAWRGIFVDLPWVPADLQQAEDRLVRIGQKSSKTLFTRLVAAHVLERRIQQLLVDKQKLFDQTITAAATPWRPK